MRRAFVRIALLVAVPVGALLVGGHYWIKGMRYASTENAYVKAQHVAVRADIDVRAVRVPVEENDRVSRGDLLFEIDPEPYRTEIAKVDAELADIRSRQAALRAEYGTAQAELAEAKRKIAHLC